MVNKYLGILTFCLSTLVLPNAGAKGQQAAHDQLAPLGYLVGEWEGEYEIPQAISEISAAKGSKAKQHISATWILEGAAIEMEFSTIIDGKKRPPSKETIFWNPKTEQISHIIVDGSGIIGRGTWRQDGNDWLLDWKGAGADADYAGTSLHRKVDGDSYIWQMRNVTKDGKDSTDWPQVKFTRTESLHEDWLAYIEGSWKSTLGDGRTGTVHFSRAINAPAITLIGENKDFSIAGVFGWHAEEQIFRETDFLSNMGVQGYLQRRFESVTPEALSGMQTSWDADKGHQSQAIEYRRVSQNEMTLSGMASESGGVAWTVRFQRQE